MGSTSVIIMEKDAQTGYLERELGSYTVEYDTNIIDRVYAVTEDGIRTVNLYLTVPGEFEDWEFNAILDNYGVELFEGKVLSVEEDEESHNPSWLIKFEFSENHNAVVEKLNEIFNIHEEEITRVLELIKTLEEDYK